MSDSVDPVSFDAIVKSIHAQGPAIGLEAMIGELRNGINHHAVFRMLLLKKRYELGLPLINPGDLSDATDSVRREYESFVEESCRQTGLLYLKDNNIPQAWRYFRTVGDRGPMKAAIEKLESKDATDEILNIALDQGVNPARGFEIVLQRDGICRAITLFDAGHSQDLSDRRRAASLLVQALYKELVVGVVREIKARFGEIPPETDLVDLIRYRPWLFENCRTHADPTHISAISRIGLLCDDPTDLIMSLSISEYGRLLDKRHRAASEPPFEAGYDDHALYARALLGQDVEKNVDHFLKKLTEYTGSVAPATIEWVIALIWRIGQRAKALDLWETHLSEVPPETPGTYIRSFYDLCQEAKDFERLAKVARKQGDLSAWAAAQVLGRPVDAS